MKRKFSTDFQHGEIETRIRVVAGVGLERLPESVVDDLQKSLIMSIANRLFANISALVETLELEQGGEYATNMEVPVVAQVAGYTCEVQIKVEVGVKISKAVLEAVVLYQIAPNFLQEAGRLITAQVLTGASQASGYGDIAVRKLAEAYLGPASAPSETPPNMGGMYI